jgi:hypothetical protein
MTNGGDAERIATIRELEQAMTAREPQRLAAKAELDQAQRTENERRKVVRAAEARVATTRKQRYRSFPAVYLNGQALDRGTVQVGNELLRFGGWHGGIDVPIASIREFGHGRSNLPPRAGVPLLGKLWPGTPRASTTLLLTVCDQDGAPTNQIVLADLSDSTAVQAEIAGRQAKLAGVLAQRQGLEAERQAALASLAEATQAVAKAQAHLKAVEAEITPYQRQRDVLVRQQRQVDAARAQAARDAQEAARRQAQHAAAAQTRSPAAGKGKKR